MDRELKLEYTDTDIQTLSPLFGDLFDQFETTSVARDAKIATFISAMSVFAAGELIRQHSPTCETAEELEKVLQLMGPIIRSHFDEMWQKAISLYMTKLKSEATARYFFEKGLQN